MSVLPPLVSCLYYGETGVAVNSRHAAMKFSVQFTAVPVPDVVREKLAKYVKNG
jgi:hypothetical protein